MTKTKTTNKMKLILGYIDKKGAHTTMPIKNDHVEGMLKSLCKKRFEAVIWEEDNRENEVGWVYEHSEAGWTWCVDSDIIKL